MAHTLGPIELVFIMLVVAVGPSYAGLMGRGVWQTVIWLIHAFVFMLIGLQLPSILERVSAVRRPGELIVMGVTVSLLVIIERELDLEALRAGA